MKYNDTNQILDILLHSFREKYFDGVSLGEELYISQLANIELSVKPTPSERHFRYNIRLAQVYGQGCCYTDFGTSFDDALVGQSALDQDVMDLATRIAVTDSIYSAFPLAANESIVLSGSLMEKSRQRARFITDNVRRLVSFRKHATVGVVGVVSEIIGTLKESGCDVLALDLDPRIIGTSVSGVSVLDGRSSFNELSQCDVLLATGMTMWTNTLHLLMEFSEQTGTPLMLYAETGAHIAPYLVSRGLDAVIAEPFPFYVFGGRAELSFYSERSALPAP